MAKRAQTPEQKREIVERLLAAWLRLPHERLGQLIDNTADECDVHPFTIEDYVLIEALELRAREDGR